MENKTEELEQKIAKLEADLSKAEAEIEDFKERFRVLEWRVNRIDR